MPIVSREDVCAQYGPADVQGCLARAAAEDRALLRHQGELKAFCAGESRSTCESFSSCLVLQDDSQFYGCVALARQQADEARAAVILWIVVIAAIAATIAAFWWRRPIKRWIALAAGWVNSVGAR